MVRHEYRNPAQRLRWAVEALPRDTKEAMLRGIERNRIIVGAYIDPRSGGVCPMLAAHRNGGRTSFAAFARAWDSYTGARRPRLARRREVATLVSFLVASLAENDLGPAAGGSIAQAAAEIRRERATLAAAEARRDRRPPALVPPEPEGAEPRIRRLRWPWARPVRGLDLVTAAESELAEGRADVVRGDSERRQPGLSVS